jgi:hypothetical protein
MSTPDAERRVLDYQDADDLEQPLDTKQHRVAAVIFISGILLLVGVGMAVVVYFVIGSLL